MNFQHFCIYFGEEPGKFCYELLTLISNFQTSKDVKNIYFGIVLAVLFKKIDHTPRITSHFLQLQNAYSCNSLHHHILPLGGYTPSQILCLWFLADRKNKSLKEV